MTTGRTFHTLLKFMSMFFPDVDGVTLNLNQQKTSLILRKLSLQIVNHVQMSKFPKQKQ